MDFAIFMRHCLHLGHVVKTTFLLLLLRFHILQKVLLMGKRFENFTSMNN